MRASSLHYVVTALLTDINGHAAVGLDLRTLARLIDWQNIYNILETYE